MYFSSSAIAIPQCSTHFVSCFLFYVFV